MRRIKIRIPYTILEISKFLGQLPVDDDGDEKCQLNAGIASLRSELVTCVPRYHVRIDTRLLPLLFYFSFGEAGESLGTRLVLNSYSFTLYIIVVLQHQNISWSQ